MDHVGGISNLVYRGYFQYIPGVSGVCITVGCKTELLLLMGSPRTAVSLDPSIWVTSGESVTLDRRGGQVLHISLVSTLLSWVIISQVGIENLKFLVASCSCSDSGSGASGIVVVVLLIVV